MIRDNNYLQQRLDHIWDRYFSDIEQGNDVRIQFGRRARSRLGSIKQSRAERISNKQFTISNAKDLSCHSELDSESLRRGRNRFLVKPGMTNKRSSEHNPTIITINGLFKDSGIPEFLIDSVIAYEMVHYAHGFASPHDKKYATPHAGGIIKKEMQERGLEDLFILQKKWLKENWRSFIVGKMPIRKRTRRKKGLIFITGR